MTTHFILNASNSLQDLAVLAQSQDPISNVVTRMAAGTTKHFGIALIVDSDCRLLGVFNNGDVLRLIAQNGDLSRPIGEVMINNPVAVPEGLTDAEILNYVRKEIRSRTKGLKELTQFIPVINDDQVVLDVLDIYDLLARAPRQGDKVAIYGLGFVGLTLLVALADRGHIVTGIDTNPEVIGSLQKAQPHVFEPRLSEMLEQGLLNESIVFGTSPGHDHHPVVIIAVGTPVDAEGHASMEALEAVCNTIGPRLRRGDLVLLRSTVPVGTTRSLVIPRLEKLSGLSIGKGFHVAFTPERTVEGQAIKELSSLPQIVGGATSGCTEKAAGFWSTLTDSVVRMDGLEAAELVKLINNSYRDLSFAFANGLALLADKYNLDAARLIAAANEGYPRNPIPKPSPGVGGYCLTKDPFLYASVDPELGHGELARVGRSINSTAGLYPLKVLRRYARHQQKELQTLKILIVGMAFKGMPETNDLRGSTAIDVARVLLNEGCSVECFDAVVTDTEMSKYGLDSVELLSGAARADAVLILNNHPQNARDGLLGNLTGRPVLLFDGWNMYDRHEVEKYMELTYATLGYMSPKVR